MTFQSICKMCFYQTYVLELLTRRSVHGLTCEAAFRPAWQVSLGIIQQGLQALGSLWDLFGVPVSRTEHLHFFPH